MTERRPVLPYSLGLIFVGLFLAYAINFLYVFVDDEGIPFVFAQNLLRGRGLAYNGIEGVVEGYSDFLHIWLSAAVLFVLNAAGLPKIWAFGMFKAVSLACGAAVIWTTFMILRAMPRVTWAGAAAGLGFLALAGPLAMWSCSSIEAARFSLWITLLVFAVVTGRDRVAGAAAVLGMLERLDGFIYVGAVLVGVLPVLEPARRVAFLRRVVLPAVGCGVTYQGWRWWYFGDLLSAPIYAKVLYKAGSADHVVRNDPEQNYVRAFVALYGWAAAALFGGASVLAVRLERLTLCLVAALTLLAAYLAIVGDWMVGFRFVLPLLPMAAILLAMGISGLHGLSRRAALAAAAITLGWCGVSAYRFAVQHDRLIYRESYYGHASAQLDRFFGPYWTIYRDTAKLVRPGDLIAYNQAGFVPFMLDVENIDNLGICSMFIAKLPTRDVVFTEVGRYSPLTPKQSLRAGDAYLLYHEPRLIIARADNLRSANAGRTPATLLWNRYRRLEIDADGENVIYARTSEPVAIFQEQPSRFLENLTHVANLTGARVDGRQVDPAQYQRTLPCLSDRTCEVQFSGKYELALDMADRDLDVYELHVNEVWSRQPVTIDLDLISASGRLMQHEGFTAPAGTTRDFRAYYDHPVRAARLSLTISGEPARAQRLRLTDVRVQGQTPSLATYVRENLSFPKPPSSLP